jgi:hypothetical protein
MTWIWLQRLPRPAVAWAMLFVTLLLYGTTPALAQFVGAGVTGTGGGLIAQLISYINTNFASGLIEACVMLAGGMMMFQRHTMAGLATMACGALVVTNSAAIGALI